jgi:hypothetical protein
VHVDALVDRGDLDAGNRFDAACGRGVTYVEHGGRGVVIGHRHDGQTDRRREIDELPRRTSTVGCGRMEMEIDHRALTRVAGAVRAGPRRTTLTFHQRAVFAQQQIEVIALFVGELEEDLLALRSPRSARRIS